MKTERTEGHAMNGDETKTLWHPVLIVAGPDDGSGIERGIRRPLPGPSFGDQRSALRMAVHALDSGKYPEAIGATCERREAE